MSTRIALASAMSISLAACSFGDDIPAAEKAIAGFHSTLNARDLAAIYLRSAPEMKNSTTPDRFGIFLGAVHRKLGLFRNGKTVGWNANVNPSGHFVTINYAANYDKGAAAESFIYRVDQDRAVLVGYHVNSDALIVN